MPVQTRSRSSGRLGSSPPFDSHANGGYPDPSGSAFDKLPAVYYLSGTRSIAFDFVPVCAANACAKRLCHFKTICEI